MELQLEEADVVVDSGEAVGATQLVPVWLGIEQAADVPRDVSDVVITLRRRR